MKLSQLLAPWFDRYLSDCSIEGLQNDSRQIKTGDLFIAYPGAASDGRLFIDKALELGAVAIVYDPIDLPKSVVIPKSHPCVPIKNLSDLLGPIAQRFYENPSSRLNVIGVTGTNGKTTIAYQLAQAHELLGQGAAYIGTIGEGDVNALRPLNNTTPDALHLQGLMHDYLNQGLKQVCMEVSSHALSQHRVSAVEFKQALFTNLTQDHLDYHHSMEEYGAAKALLFSRPELEWAIINQDDAHQETMSRAIKPQVKKLTYGMNLPCDVRAHNWRMDLDGTQIEVTSPWGQHQIKINALGQFNIYNSLAVFSSLMASGYAVHDVVRVIAKLKAAPGRMEVVANAPYVLVDYAHTPDALENALSTLSQLKKAKLWVVFGCGGDRDKTKRPIMGKAASLYADKIIITSDNPRSENPESIVEDIAHGVPRDSKLVKLIHREEAIAYALNEAAPEDIILIAGKGHEAYQQIGAVKYDFSDQEVVKRLISKS